MDRGQIVKSLEWGRSRVFCWPSIEQMIGIQIKSRDGGSSFQSVNQMPGGLIPHIGVCIAGGNKAGEIFE